MKVPVWIVRPDETVWYWLHTEWDRAVYDTKSGEMYVFKTKEDADTFLFLQTHPEFVHVESRSATVGELYKRFELGMCTIVPDDIDENPADVRRSTEEAKRRIRKHIERKKNQDIDPFDEED